MFEAGGSEKYLFWRQSCMGVGLIDRESIFLFSLLDCGYVKNDVESDGLAGWRKGRTARRALLGAAWGVVGGPADPAGRAKGQSRSTLRERNNGEQNALGDDNDCRGRRGLSWTGGSVKTLKKKEQKGDRGISSASLPPGNYRSSRPYRRLPPLSSPLFTGSSSSCMAYMFYLRNGALFLSVPCPLIFITGRANYLSRKVKYFSIISPTESEIAAQLKVCSS